MGPDTYWEDRYAVDLNSATAQGAARAANVPLILRAVALVILNDVGATGVAVVKKRPIIGSAAGESVIATFSLTTADVLGRVRYKDNLTVQINPGQEIVTEVTDVAAAGDLAEVVYLWEPAWERPGNFTNMVAGT
jgi:hypothetical protein